MQEEEDGWWNGRVGDVFGTLPSTYVEAVSSVNVKFRAQGLYEFQVGFVRIFLLPSLNDLFMPYFVTVGGGDRAGIWRW